MQHHDSIADIRPVARVSRGASWTAIAKLGDGDLEGRLVALAAAHHLEPDLFAQDVEETARDFSAALDDLQTWDDDLAQEVNAAALAYMIAVCRLVRNATGG
ncbi:MAG: hypothetical protein AB7P97_21890 [Hyphomonadaceae bacterium]